MVKVSSKAPGPKLLYRIQAKLVLWRRVWNLSKQLLALGENQLQRAEWLVDSERDLVDMRAASARYIAWAVSDRARYDRMGTHYPTLDSLPWEKDNG